MRWQTHLANVPFQAEFADSGKDDNAILAGLAMDTVEFKYNENFKNIFDLYTNNSTTENRYYFHLFRLWCGTFRIHVCRICKSDSCGC